MRVDWANRAVADLQDIRDTIAEDSEKYAAQTIRKIVEAVDPLQDFPKLGRHIPEYQAESHRELIQGPYRIFYEIQDHRILITGVMHGRRDLVGLEPKPWA